MNFNLGRTKGYFFAVFTLVGIILIGTLGVSPLIAEASNSVIPTEWGPEFQIIVGNNLYTPNYGSNSVSVINTTNNTVIATIPVGVGPLYSIDVGSYLYMANYGGNTVSVIDTNPSDPAYNTVVATLTVGTQPQLPILAGNNLYVANHNSNNVSVISTLTNTVIATIAVGTDPQLATLVGTNLYVPNVATNNVSVIDTNPADAGTYNTVTTTIGGMHYPQYYAIPATVVGNRYLYELNLLAASVSVIDTNTNTVTSTITVGTNPSFETLVGSILYVFNKSNISVIDTSTNSVITTIATGTNSLPRSSILEGANLYVSESGGNTVSVIDTNPADGAYNTITSTITVGMNPDWNATGSLEGIDPGTPPAGNTLYVANYSSGTVSVIDTTTGQVTATIPTGTHPNEFILVGTTMYVINSGDNFVTTIDTTLYDVPAPSRSAATVSGNTLSLAYNEPLNPSSIPSTGDFAVTANGSPVSVSSVTVSGSAVTLTLASTPAGSAAVVANYTPGSNLIEDLNRTDQSAAALSSQAVTNENTISLSYTAGPGGSLVGTTSQTTNYGSSGTAVTAVPNSGYSFVHWSDGSTQNPRTDINIARNISVTADFATVPATIAVGSAPESSTLVGNDLYVLNSGDGTVSVVNSANDSLITTIAVGSAPESSTLVGNDLYVTNRGNGTVSVINTTNNTVIATITVGLEPESPILVGTSLYVMNEYSNSVSAIDTNPSDGTYNTVTATVATGTGPGFPVSVGTSLYVPNGGSGTVSVINTSTNTLSKTITVGSNPGFLIIAGSNIYVPNYNSGTVSVINTSTNTVTATITVGTEPQFPVLIGTNLYVANSGSNTVSVIDTNPSDGTYNTVTATISVPLTRRSSVVPVGSNLYVTNFSGGNAAVIDTTTNEVTSTVSVGSDPGIPTLVGTSLYVPNMGSRTITAIDTTLYDAAPPNLTASSVDGDILTLTYDQNLNPSSTPAPTDFTISVDGNPVTVSSVQVTGSTLILTLASQATASDTVTASYVQGSNLIQDLDRSDATASAFTSETVTSDTPPVISSEGLSGKTSGGGYLYVCTDPKASNYDTYPAPGNTTCIYAPIAVTVTPAASQTTKKAAYVFKRNLKQGMSGQDVKLLQEYLGSHGYQVTKPGKETLLFGSLTKKELSLFQKSGGLHADGIFGTKTRAYVNNHQ